MGNQAYETMVKVIVKKMETIIGPVAFTLANKVSGLVVSKNGAAITGSPEKVIADLLNQYKKIIGISAITLAKRSLGSFLSIYPNLKVPKELRGD